jgi:hypothetical protein
MRLAKVARPALVMFQPAVPVMSLPLPALEIVIAAPEADELDWVTPRTEPVSVPVPVMLLVNWRKAAVSFNEPAELVTTVLLNKMSALESAEVRVPLRLN